MNEKELGEGQPSLVVVPNTLLFNWQRESKKFSPELNVLLYHGSIRHNYLGILCMADVVLTTYGTLVRDIDKLKDIFFHYIILDEAHIIKNPASQVSKAVRTLKSRYRLALTGTPIENNLSELWSIFTFLNPGLLGSFKSFLKSFIKPIENELNENTMDTLRKLIYPFILRRTKSQVAKDLPPKNEIILYAEMLPRQLTFYNLTKELYYSKIKKIVDERELEIQKIQILEGLLRLRQICCHPKLFDKNYSDDSGKFQLIESMLINATAEKHKSLVFSQFTGALKLLQNRLACIGINSEILTGETSDRQKVVDRFQAKDGPPVFLISLKAGGVGLNLTAADYVFHLDPWWNPAAENQATDRAYRIGQTRTVFIYKLITKDSIEEKVLELQEKKRLLMNGIIKEESSFFKNLTKEDLLSLFE
ncbi:MAG: DEAD/DEAH box helicase [Chitinispirillaceae bacterium]|nr:DEAD/DEAH box helicase [Chitinispirillaceae bacterium]